ncbi:MAG TPA: response regulator [Gammaproteobacteria bacterium]|nr:response regulator [Gammaproteobacteria bacterium]
MSKTIRILIVEDNDDQYEAYEDAADEISNDNLKIELERKKSAGNAKEALLSNNFDGAIVDLNLVPGNPQDASGNDVLSEIIERHRFPVYVVSGNLGNLDEGIRSKKSEFLDFHDRGKPNNEIFEKLVKIYLTGITRILGGRGQIEERLGEIFWKHLASSFDVWTSKEEESERTLLRYTVSHLAEYLDIPDGKQRYYHEAEFYIKPTIREHIATGDIVERDGGRFIVLSPPCDVAVRGIDNNAPKINAARITLAPLIKVNRESFVNHGIFANDDSSKSKKSALDKIIKGQREKYIFIPGYKELFAAVVDLQNLHTVDFKEFSEFNRLATISSPFLKDIQSRFSAYFGRQGQPDMDKAELLNKYKGLLSPEN